MKFYCMCSLTDSIEFDIGKAQKRKFILGTPMEVVQMGAEQYIGRADSPKKHYPNLDVLKCRFCNKEMILEG